MNEILIHRLLLAGLASALLPLLPLGALALFNRRASEGFTGRLVPAALGLAFLCLAAAFGLLGGGQTLLQLGQLFAVADVGFRVSFFADAAALWFAVLSCGICFVVAVFAHRYLHREVGYNRFFILLTIFAIGLLLVILAGSLEVLLAGWEMLGLSSALLVAFFHERPLPVQNALRIFAIYRLGDATLLAATVLMHHLLGAVHGAPVLHGAAEAASRLSGAQATLVGGLVLIAAAAKCAQLPFSNWLPRAMEGPTPSSAVFYGALSIHAGAYLLLRAQPILERSPVLSGLLLAMGLCSAVFSTLVGRVQTDIKCALSYASLTQVSVILVEIALGLFWLPVLHLSGHAILRLVQFLRSPSLLHDLHELEDAIGRHVHHRPMDERHWRLYRWALERGHLDAWLDLIFVAPLRAFFRGCDRLERRWADGLAGLGHARPPVARGCRGPDGAPGAGADAPGRAPPPPRCSQLLRPPMAGPDRR